MTKKDLTYYQRKRLIQVNQKCTRCGELISNDENLTFTKTHIGRIMKYDFYHERCENGEEKERESESESETI